MILAYNTVTYITVVIMTVFMLPFTNNINQEISEKQKPSYIVDLSKYEDGGVKCTGVMVEKNELVTVAHCLENMKYIFNSKTKINEKLEIEGTVYYNREYDLVFARLKNNINLKEYGKIASENDVINGKMPFEMFGNCIYSNPNKVRYMFYFTEYVENNMKNHILFSYSCSGDSGAPIIQNGKIFFLLKQVCCYYDDNTKVFYGNLAIAVDAKEIN